MKVPGLLTYAIFPYYKRKRQREEEWYGVVEEKKVKSDYSLSKYEHIIVFRTDDGQRIKMKVNEELSNKYEKGRRYCKRVGEDFPDPVS